MRRIKTCSSTSSPSFHKTFFLNDEAWPYKNARRNSQHKTLDIIWRHHHWQIFAPKTQFNLIQSNSQFPIQNPWEPQSFQNPQNTHMTKILKFQDLQHKILKLMKKFGYPLGNPSNEMWITHPKIDQIIIWVSLILRFIPKIFPNIPKTIIKTQQKGSCNVAKSQIFWILIVKYLPPLLLSLC